MKANGKTGFLAELKTDYKRRSAIYWMVLPIVAYYIIFEYIPMAGQVIVFQNFRPARGFLNSHWVGLGNFFSFFRSIYASRVIRNTLLINFYQLIFGFPAPIILALIMNELGSVKYKRVCQTIQYMPHFISAVVMCGIIVDFCSSRGFITSVVGWFGVEATNLLTIPQYFRPIYVGSGIWKEVGWGSIIYLATISTVDMNLYEAAAIDGAGRLRKIWHINLPALIPIIAIRLILNIGQMMSEGADKVILLYNPSIYETADIISSYVYRVGLTEMNYSLAAAVGMFNSVVNFCLLYSANWFSRHFVKESFW